MPTLTRIVRRLVTWRGGVSLRCVGCGRTRTDGVRFVSGPGIYICSACSADAALRIAASPPQTQFSEACSFCGVAAVGIPFAADGRRMICVDCIVLTEKIFAEDQARRPAP